MKRVQLFEFEDFAWFPNWIRKPMTRYVAAIHKVLGTHNSIANLLVEIIHKTGKKEIIDLCSGSGGPMPDVKRILEQKHEVQGLNLWLSDLYPDSNFAEIINNDDDPTVSYVPESVNAAHPNTHQNGIRTLICSLHHMAPEMAKSILKDTKEAKQPFLAFEISDNSIPLFIAWIAIPFGLLMTLFVTPLVRPMTWQQLVFTYIIPILPLFIAWDGGVSNMRTYTIADMDILLEGLQDDDYQWKTGAVEGRGGKKLFLMGWPT